MECWKTGIPIPLFQISIIPILGKGFEHVISKT